MKHPKGFILIELIMTIVLIGIIATFTGLFIFSGINGYLRAQYITNGSLDAQRALDRISLELRDITAITSEPSTTSLTYRSETLTGTRTLKYDGNTDTIFIRKEPTDYILLENVSAFDLSWETYNMDADPLAVEEVRFIQVAFNLEDIGTDFRTRIFPRNLVTKTW
jgi:prepilin-type N-terminal cleavage/methylation domain-containing protein